MGGDLATIDSAAAEAMLAWWIESGVDTPVEEEPRNWLHAASQSPARPPQRADVAPLPADLDSFRLWLAESPELPLARPGAHRVLPTGKADAPLMVMADLPSTQDGDQPIGGEARILAERMLQAIGIDPGDAYFANLSCLSIPGVSPTPDELKRCAEIARRHVALARPKRLLLLGEGPARALLGAPFAQARGKVHKVEGIRTVATFAPRMLLDQTSQKAAAWRDLLLLMEEE